MFLNRGFASEQREKTIEESNENKIILVNEKYKNDHESEFGWKQDKIPSKHLGHLFIKQW